MEVINHKLEGLVELKPIYHKDHRGQFAETYNAKTMEKESLNSSFIQDNESVSKYGVVRGLHYQINPNAQAKLVRVLSGKILDVAVDLRADSKTFGKWVAVELSEENAKQLLIPRGFAHGFSVLSKTAKVLYKCDNYYDPSSERGIRFDDPSLNIDWKVPLEEAIVSERDLALPNFKGAEFNFSLSTAS